MARTALLLAGLGGVALAFGLLTALLAVLQPFSDPIWIVGNLAVGLVLLAAAAFMSLETLRERMRTGASRRAGRYGTSAVLGAVFSIAILGFLAFLSVRHAHRIDVSESKVHTLSEQTKSLLARLDQDVTITAFFAESEAPPVRDLLDRYAFENRERVELAFVEPNDAPGLVEELGLGSEDLARGVVRIANANNLYLCRSYAFVAAGPQGLAIVDIEKPTEPKPFPWLPGLYFNADGKISDTHDVKIGMTNNSLFAYIADGKNGMHVVQLMSFDDTPGIYGFSPRLSPKLVATKKTGGPALAISEGIDRDRAVDESGNQLAVFGRRGARPFNLAEIRKLFISSSTGQPYTVSNAPPGPPIAVSERSGSDEAAADTDTNEPGGLALGQQPVVFDVVALLLPMGLLLGARRRGRPRGTR